MIKRFLLVAVAAVSFAACSSDNKVGTGVDTDVTASDGGRLGETTTTVAAPGDTTPTTAAPTTTAPPTTAKPTPTTQAASIEVSITEANFSPQNVQIFVGQQVKFVNKTSEPRSINASDNSFSSGDIAPGASWVFQTNRAGRYDIVDGTRPYVVGVIEVRAR